MGKEQQSKYYDDIYSVSLQYQQSYKKSTYLPTWTLAMQLINRLSESPSLLDIGCGTGQFAQFITEHLKVNYTGLDFSEKAIEIANTRDYEKRLTDRPPIFIHADVFSPFIWEQKFDIYTIMETLEHIENDIEILSRVPEGALVILTIPTFDDQGHVRFFTKPEDALKRYGKYIGSETSNDAKCIEQIRAWYIIYGHRNSLSKQIQVTL